MIDEADAAVVKVTAGDREVADEAFDLFEEIYDITQENPNNKWNRAKFTLMPSGDFTTDFEWDQSLTDEIEANS